MTELTVTPSFPPPNRLYWMRPEGSPLKLAYLTWGQRFYGRQPSPFVRAGRWNYVVVRRGGPILVLRGREEPLAPRDVFLAHPDCVYCLRDERDRRCEVLGWQWDSPPVCKVCLPPPKGSTRWSLTPEELRRIEQIHASCRQEVSSPDDYCALSLDQLRTALDVALARSRESRRLAPHPAEHYELAVRWMQEHLTVAEPVQHICDYLQVSPSTLRRLFLRQIKESPAAYFHRLKMERARELLQRMSVKETAFRLGYRYPNDFSKAYKDFFGVNPTDRSRRRSGCRLGASTA